MTLPGSTPHPFWHRLLSLFLCLNLALPGTTLAASLQLPEIGSPSASLLTPAQEQRIGQEFMRHIRKNHAVVNDPLLSSYIEELGYRLVQQSGHSGARFHFFLIQDPSINAFAGPGGYIGVNTGLILASETESELASVIAHEIAHVNQQHLLRRFDALNRLSLPMLALMIAAIAAGGGEAAQAILATTQAGSAQLAINYTREHEYEADRLGIQLLHDAGFDPTAMASFFTRLASRTRVYESSAPEYLRTHPVTTNRIAEAQGLAQTRSYRQYPDSSSYHLSRARLRATSMGSPLTASQHFAQILEEGRHLNRDAARYGLAISLSESGQNQAARREIEPLLQAEPDNHFYLLAQSTNLTLAGKQADAIKLLRSALKRQPGQFTLQLELARLLLDEDKPTESLQLLQALSRDYPNQLAVWQSIVHCQTRLGNQAGIHKARAEKEYLLGNQTEAIRQLELARETTGHEQYHELASIQAKLKLWQESVAQDQEGE